MSPSPTLEAESKEPHASAEERERAALSELIEVERSLAALQGRSVENVEHIVFMRADAEKRRAALEVVITETRREVEQKRKKKLYTLGAAMLMLGVLGGLSVPIVRSLSGQLEARDAAIATLSVGAKPFERSFSVLRTEMGPQTFTVPADAGRCFVIVSASADGVATKVKVERRGEAHEGASVGLCSCAPEEIQVTPQGGVRDGAIVLQAPANAMGGAFALAAQSPRPDVLFAATDNTCAQAAFDAWLAAHTPEAVPPSEKDLSPSEMTLTAQGLRAATANLDTTHFVVVPKTVSTNHCTLAVRKGGGTIELRLPGGERRGSTKSAAIGFCAKDASGLSVWGENPGTIRLFSGPRAKVGGLLGLHDMATRAHLTLSTWVPADELDEDAANALSASGISTTLSGLAPGRPAVVSVSVDVRSTLTATDTTAGVSCVPPLDVGAIQTLCLEGRPGAFAPTGTLPPGVVRGAQPLWLALSDTPDSFALERGLEVLAFSRRMTALGFELTSLVGATFTPKGLKVTGRNGEKEVVAIILAAEKPYFHTLSKGAPWTLEDPKMTALQPKDEVEFVATPRLSTTKTKREFIVWRR